MIELVPPNPGAFWRTLGQRATGMTVVTAADAGGPAGFLGLSASHVSASPPTLLVSISRSTHALATVLASRHFAVNFLPAGTEALADAFAGKAEVPPERRFAADAWTTLATGAPVLKGALGAFDCAVDMTVDHEAAMIVIGRVQAYACAEEGEPLLFFRGRTVSGLAG